MRGLHRGRRRRAWLPALGGLCLALPAGQAAAQNVNLGDLTYQGPSLRDTASGILGVVGYTLVPGSAATSLQITKSSTGNPNLSMFQLGSGFTVSDGFPLYLEGFIGYARYDPRFVFSAGGESSRLPTRWNSLGANGGIGWDFRVSNHWYLRPILDLTFGYVASDATLFGYLLDKKFNVQLDFLRRGQMMAAGGGASFVAAYYLRREAYQADLELRSTNLFLSTLPSTNVALHGTNTSISTSIWARLRWPSGMIMFRRPVRYVLEGMQSTFYGHDAQAIGIGTLYSIGAGLESDVGGLEIGALGLEAQRVRVVGRYFFGPHVSGTSVGLGISF